MSKLNNFPHLSRPITLAGLTLKNRIFSAPTSVADLNDNECYTKENIEYYKLRAAGGAAVVCIGEIMVDLENGRSHAKQIGINEPKALSAFSNLIDAVHSHGAAISAELDHGGALCAPAFLGKNPKGPSAYVDDWGDTIEEMTEEEIYFAADKFAEGAKNAKAMGFDMVTLHGGHGWLIHQFISPLTNFRTDKWGGSFENRMRFALLVIEKVRAAVGRAFPIEIRISGAERIEGGYDIDTGVEIAKMLDGKVDLIHVSAGTQQVDYSAVLMHPGPFQSDMENSYLAAEIKKHVKTPVLSVGAFNTPEQMEKFLADGHADCIALGRPLLADPFFPKKALSGREDEITPCIRCTDCLGGMIAKQVMRCTVNPVIGRECDFFHPIPVRTKKKVLIAGGGPGGMQAALTAYEKGHEVVLCEAREKLGGALKFADSGADFKKPMLRYRESQIRKVMSLPIDVRLNTKVDEAVVAEVKPDVLIAAVGADPIILPIPGADGDNVFIGADLMPDTPLGKRVVIIGGGLIGCEEAIHLAREGHEVTIMEMLPEIASECYLYHKMSLYHHIEELNINVAAGMACSKIQSDGVLAKDAEGNENFFPCDSVVFAAGMRSRSSEVEKLRPLAPKFYVVGDANKAKNVMMAVRDGYDAVFDMGIW